MEIGECSIFCEEDDFSFSWEDYMLYYGVLISL